MLGKGFRGSVDNGSFTRSGGESYQVSCPIVRELGFPNIIGNCFK